MRTLALGLVAATFMTSAAMAQTPLSFTDVDIDADGRLSFVELQTVWPSLTQEEFNSVDVEGAGSITAEQLALLQQSSAPAGAPAAGAAPATAPMDAVPAPLDAPAVEAPAEEPVDLAPPESLGG